MSLILKWTLSSSITYSKRYMKIFLFLQHTESGISLLRDRNFFCTLNNYSFKKKKKKKDFLSFQNKLHFCILYILIGNIFRMTAYLYCIASEIDRKILQCKMTKLTLVTPTEEK